MTTSDQEPVSPDLYTEEYYLNCCSGADTFEASHGMAVSPLLIEVLDRIGVGPGKTCLDVGCGRGEVVFNAARRGATAVGLDYADAALRLAQKMLGASHADLADRVVFVKADAKAMPLPTASADAAFMLDIVEHLQPWELDAAFAEVRRVLKPTGTLFVHTMPNRNYYQWIYPPLARLARLRGQEVSLDPRSEYEHQMHVNEQTPGGLARSLKQAGFNVDLWVTGLEKWPALPGGLNRVAQAIARRPPLKRLAAFHILALAT